jgi:hypothetical protein
MTSVAHKCHTGMGDGPLPLILRDPGAAVRDAPQYALQWLAAVLAEEACPLRMYLGLPHNAMVNTTAPPPPHAELHCRDVAAMAAAPASDVTHCVPDAAGRSSPQQSGAEEQFTRVELGSARLLRPIGSTHMHSDQNKATTASKPLGL